MRSVQLNRRRFVGVALGATASVAGGDHRSPFDELGIDRFLAQAAAGGTPPFAIATADGGDTYWHRRSSGIDSGAMIVDALVPPLAARDLDTSCLGYIGWSMGG